MKALDDMSQCGCLANDGAESAPYLRTSTSLLPNGVRSDRAYDPHEDQGLLRRRDPHEDYLLHRGGMLDRIRVPGSSHFKPPPPPGPGPGPNCTLLAQQLLDLNAELKAIAMQAAKGDLSKIAQLAEINTTIEAIQVALAGCFGDQSSDALFAFSQDVEFTVGEFVQATGTANTPITIRFGAIFMTFYPPLHTTFSYFLMGGSIGGGGGLFQFLNTAGSGTLDPISGKMEMGIQFETTFGSDKLSFALSTEEQNTLAVLKVPNGKRAAPSGPGGIAANVTMSGPGISIVKKGQTEGLEDFFTQEQISFLEAFIQDIPYPMAGSLSIRGLSPSPLVGG